MGKVTGRRVIGRMVPEMLVIGTTHPTDVVHVKAGADGKRDRAGGK